ncbi:hypothetical protein [Pontibacillus halophilus]|uniref:hypothetical protein n=1 Tax=Pontibacillus halophilus TaxID=516704 RepID=UPI000407F230|nr:hypothetical protein [Pontibacillus halophilus]
MDLRINSENAIKTMEILLEVESYLEMKVDKGSLYLNHLKNMRRLINTYFERTINAGYCPSIFEGVLSKKGQDVAIKKPHLKQNLDEEFYLNLSSYKAGESVIDHFYKRAMQEN